MKEPVIIVSGLPRSGTSMMMQILEAGGIPVLSDNQRQPDEDNPHGYYEYAPVKHLEEEHSFLYKARGRAVKIVSKLLYFLPADLEYEILFIERDIEEILLSQQKMLEKQGKATSPEEEEELAHTFQKHLNSVRVWLDARSNISTLYVNYKDVIFDTKATLESINEFLSRPMDVDTMYHAVHPELYRSRKS